MGAPAGSWAIILWQPCQGCDPNSCYHTVQMRRSDGANGHQASALQPAGGGPEPPPHDAVPDGCDGKEGETARLLRRATADTQRTQAEAYAAWPMAGGSRLSLDDAAARRMQEAAPLLSTDGGTAQQQQQQEGLPYLRLSSMNVGAAEAVRQRMSTHLDATLSSAFVEPISFPPTEEGYVSQVGSCSQAYTVPPDGWGMDGCTVHAA